VVIECPQQKAAQVNARVRELMVEAGQFFYPKLFLKMADENDDLSCGGSVEVFERFLTKEIGDQQDGQAKDECRSSC
jgi:hypothetical protein